MYFALFISLYFFYRFKVNKDEYVTVRLPASGLPNRLPPSSDTIS